jgi:hypothetical protein
LVTIGYGGSSVQRGEIMRIYGKNLPPFFLLPVIMVR